MLTSSPAAARIEIEVTAIIECIIFLSQGGKYDFIAEN
jgi:hypothetical protein